MSTCNSFEDGTPEREAKPRLALIAGPTASGKSDLAVAVAQMERAAGREAVVINADSAQVYADLRVLSARPSDEEMQGIPHRLFGAWDGAVACSAADWAAAARAEIASAHAAGALPILVGGTGLYIRTLLDGIAPVPSIDPDVRGAVRALPVAEAYAALRQEDPERAAALNPADATRVARALEVVRSTGHPLAHWQAERTGGIGDAVALRPLILLPERAWLYARCDLRFERMWEAGALGEVEALLARGLDPDLPVMRAIGVPEIAAFLAGEMTREAAISAGQQATRRYAKRQYTWLRHQNPGDWPRIVYENSIDTAHAASLLRS
ncbi:tRNA (adenosine(37)-N6)-dimethylallyltransferase MiaA [Novosphingobium sp. KCTC 2891]|uniref:tRNA (adenosine(37)-N6)-dimethylallyltransferase MiaA n=1 Tax=Novosphingobium sp. KCTC 2891 TaxID=2989730 RepID=UPI002221C8F6|nr:tRNA (adenosine(37)-N6)-dimethylallyltransferase MiaA [Novosphingobium sp. KCTC 2891]MCW1381772.1 tRNA (adenosine(37)-N6)-dimethylallyltransferase MiaA [Novosphingobium sp. KCTC 2891]